MIDDFGFVKEVLGSYKLKVRKYKTFLMRDASNKLFRIAKAEDVEKRFKTIYSNNPNLEIKLIIDDDVKNQILKEFESKIVTHDWLSLSKEDFQSITIKYKTTK